MGRTSPSSHVCPGRMHIQWPSTWRRARRIRRPSTTSSPESWNGYVTCAPFHCLGSPLHMTSLVKPNSKQLYIVMSSMSRQRPRRLRPESPYGSQEVLQAPVADSLTDSKHPALLHG